jgi:hypothetical protein
MLNSTVSTQTQSKGNILQGLFYNFYELNTIEANAKKTGNI